MQNLRKYLLILVLMTAPFAYGAPNDDMFPSQHRQGEEQQRPYDRNAEAREMFAKRLNLTDEQKQTLDKYRQEDMAEIKPVLQDMFAKRNEYDFLTTSNMPAIEKEAKMLKLKGEMKDLKAKADEMRSKNMKRFESVLTDEQKAEFEKIKAERRQQPPQHPRFFENFGRQQPPKNF